MPCQLTVDGCLTPKGAKMTRSPAGSFTLSVLARRRLRRSVLAQCGPHELLKGSRGRHTLAVTEGLEGLVKRLIDVDREPRSGHGFVFEALKKLFWILGHT